MATKRKPDYKVKIAVPYTNREGEQKYRYFEVGSGWKNPVGISFILVTNPQVRYHLFAVDEKPAQGEEMEGGD